MMTVEINDCSREDICVVNIVKYNEDGFCEYGGGFVLSDGEAKKLRDQLIKRYPIDSENKEDRKDIRHDDIVTFTKNGKCYESFKCYDDGTGEFLIIDSNQPVYFYSRKKDRLYEGVTDLSVCRWIRTKEPNDPGIYLSQSEKTLLHRSDRMTWTLFEDFGFKNMTWERLKQELDEKEFPLVKAEGTKEHHVEFSKPPKCHCGKEFESLNDLKFHIASYIAIEGMMKEEE